MCIVLLLLLCPTHSWKAMQERNNSTEQRTWRPLFFFFFPFNFFYAETPVFVSRAKTSLCERPLLMQRWAEQWQFPASEAGHGINSPCSRLRCLNFPYVFKSKKSTQTTLQVSWVKKETNIHAESNLEARKCISKLGNACGCNGPSGLAVRCVVRNSWQ